VKCCIAGGRGVDDSSDGRFRVEDSRKPEVAVEFVGGCGCWYCLESPEVQEMIIGVVAGSVLIRLPGGYLGHAVGETAQSERHVPSAHVPATAPSVPAHLISD